MFYAFCKYFLPKMSREVNYGDFGAPKQATKATSSTKIGTAAATTNSTDVKLDLDNARGFGILAGIRFSF